MKSSILSISQRSLTRRRLPRPFLGDRVLKPFLLDAALGQALLYDSCVNPSGLLSLNLGQILTGRRRRGGGGEGPAYPFRSDLYEAHFVLNGAQVLVVTNRRLVLLDASDFVWLQKRVMSGQPQPLGSTSDVPGGEIAWQLPWEGLLAAEVAWHSQTPGLPPDGIILHRKRRGGPESSILHDLRCRPGSSQAQEVLATIQACRYKHYLLPKTEAAGWRELRGLNVDQREVSEGEASAGVTSFALSPSPDQLKPDTMPCVEFKPIWYRRALHGSVGRSGSVGLSGSSSSAMLKNAGGAGGGGRKAISVWRPVGPPGYSSLGDVLVSGLETPPNPVKLYKDLSLFSVTSSAAAGGGGGGGLRIGGGEKEAHDAPGEGPRLASPIGYALIFRDSAYPPVTIWRPTPPPGYVEVGCVAWPDMEEPPLSLVRCVRKDLVMAAETYETCAWSGASADNQWWRCTLWPIDNAAQTFLASKNDHRPDKARTPVY